ncbi:DUF2341 domain-containing protein, partial [bacterium]|nr:DUF2341 domain-containing protein [bacterium]
FQRLPDRPQMMTSNIMPHAISLVQAASAALSSESLTIAAVGDPEKMAFEVLHARKATYGFSLRHPNYQARPVVFSPPLGEPASQWTAGEGQEVAWRVLAWPGRWTGALEYVSKNIMGVTDYREPAFVSLTDALLNMFDLLNNTDASGWAPDLKGYYDIESVSLGKQAAPLVLLSASMLQRDEDYFKSRGLPTLEFTLTRPGSAMYRADAENLESVRLRVPSTFYSTAYWMGAHELLGELNPWLDEFILPGGEIYYSSSYNESSRWAEKLEIYRYRPDPALLAEIKLEADEFINTSIFGRLETPINYQSFYNISFVPWWYDLPDLYDVTGEERFRQAAEEGAFHTMAGLWSHPPIPENPGTSVTIHTEFDVIHPTAVWWKDGEPYRLGYPLPPGGIPQKEAESWLVSHVGLGLEQPSTYFQGEERMANIQQSSWSPQLLRAFGDTGRDVIETYARNGTIGRFSNYPGYYLCDFTDIHMAPDFPYVGPDISNIYYHHIPVHTGWVADYLFTQANVRSSGRIDFPWVKQKNYAWFTFRAYGTQPGEIFGETGAVPWLARDIVQLDTKYVDWLAARSANRFFLILMSQSDRDLDVGLTLNSSLIGLNPALPGRKYVGSNPTALSILGAPTSVNVPAKGIVTLSLAAQDEELYPKLPPLEAGHLIRYPSGGDWGQLHAFRIRSPFGHDGLYVALTRGPLDGANVILTLAGHGEVLTDNYNPYEFTVYPWDWNQDMNVQVHIDTPDQTISFTLPAQSDLDVESATATEARKVVVVFEREVDLAAASMPSKYSIDASHAVTNATVQADGRSVVLTLDSSLSASGVYNLTVSGVQDFWGHSSPDKIAPISIGPWEYANEMLIVASGLELTYGVQDFPLLVRLDSSTIHYGQCQPGGSDLHFRGADGGLLPSQIETWNPQGTSSVWVKAPFIEGGVARNVVHMFYGGSSLNTSPASVWSEYSGVWHLANAQDSTAYANHGTAANPVTAAGMVGDCQHFDGNDDIVIPDSNSLDLGSSPFTISAWIRKDDLATMMVASKNFGGTSYMWSWGWGTDQIAFRSWNNYYYSEPGSLVQNEWHYITFVENNGAGRAYVDGEPSGESLNTGAIGSLDNSEAMRIGSRLYDGNPGYQFRGDIDELRLEKQARTDDWVKACYLNQKPDGFLVRVEPPPKMGLSVRHWTGY